MFRKTLLGLAAGVSTLVLAAPAQAQSLFYMGRVILVGFTFCPTGTAEANGAILSIAQNTALFSLIGTTYGGNGVTTFALPDLRGRVPNAWGQGPGLSNYQLGQTGGTETVTVTVNEMAMHTHVGWSRAVEGTPPNSDDPTNASPADFPSGQTVYNNVSPPNASMAADTAVLQPAGGNQPFSNLSPYLTMRYCIVTQGVFPPRG